MSSQIVSSEQLQVTGEPLPSDSCPDSPSSLHSLISANIRVMSNGAGIKAQSSQPSAEFHDKIWLRLTDNGTPFALYYRNTVKQRWEPANGVPVGSIQIFGSASIPHGWLDCDGTQYNSTQDEYEMLYEAIGTSFNIGGEAAGMFRVPDFRARMPMGAGLAGGRTHRTVGGYGGSETHTLTVDEIPPHTHPYDKPVPSDAGRHSGGHDQDISTGQPSGSTGGGQPHNNIPPFQAATFMIRYM